LFNGAVAAFTSTTAGATAADFSATIDWGDSTSSAGSVTATSAGGFLVNGMHTYAEEGSESVTVTISDHGGNTATAMDAVKVADAPLLARGVTIGTQHNGEEDGNAQGTSGGQGNTLVLTNQVVATFVDTGGAEALSNYSATIDWGDGSATSSGKISLSSDGTFFNISGSHTFTGHGPFVVTVTIKDEGGAHTTATSLVVNGHVELDDDDAFVEQAFDDVLERNVDQHALAFFANAVQNGLPPSAVAMVLTQSDEFLENVIRQAYLNFLGRDADDAGLSFWLSQMRHGLTDQQLDAGFIGSNEFFSHSGGTNQSWVNEMYFDLLGRAPDATGQAFWVNALAHGTLRTSVALGFAASSEHESQVVQSDYQTFLGRTASQAEVNGWVSAAQHGMTNEQIVAGFVGSSEYFQDQASGD
jgi:hypothetical protein